MFPRADTRWRHDGWRLGLHSLVQTSVCDTLRCGRGKNYGEVRSAQYTGGDVLWAGDPAAAQGSGEQLIAERRSEESCPAPLQPCLPLSE